MRKKILFLTMALLAAALLSGCAGGPVRGTTWPGLAADDNAAYLADGPYMHAINLQDGKELWRYPAESDNDFVFYATPVITPDGLVIVGSAGTNHSLVALNPTDLTQNANNTKSPTAAWTFNDARDQWVAPPLVVDDKLFAVNSDGYLYVLDLQDGQSTKKAVKAIRIGGRLWAKPTTDGERVFLTSLDHNVIAVDIETYEVLWNEEIEGAVAGSAVLGPDGMLYAGSFASQLEKIDPASGKREPALKAEYWIWSTSSLDGDTLYFADLNGNVYSFNTSTGKLNWPAIKPDGPITASPLIQNDHIIIATESGSLFAIDRDGNILWTQVVGGKIYTTPVAAGDLTIVAPLETDFYLAALDQNGRQVWAFTPGN
ncbi:MAG TPA: PQQ-binding-like beta-propeller repeat protein [Anaerolineales bacterium]|nr:PQQ-binding-like beta-propeller repeat protein [Anaerolineales bacterium]